MRLIPAQGGTSLEGSLEVGTGQEQHSLAEAVVKTFCGTEADDGVDHSGCIHGCEAIDDRHDHRVHLTVVAAEESSGHCRLGMPCPPTRPHQPRQGVWTEPQLLGYSGRGATAHPPAFPNCTQQEVTRRPCPSPAPTASVPSILLFLPPHDATCTATWWPRDP